MALQIVLHTLRMIFRNLQQALRVSVFPFLILFVAGLVLTAVGARSTRAYQDPFTLQTVQGPGMMTILLTIGFFFVLLFVTAWIAVSWHRFILKEEYPSWIPTIQDRPIWPYAGKALLLGLMVVVIAIPLFMILGFIMTPLLPASALGTPGIGAGMVGLLVFAIVFVVLGYLSLRWGVALVGTALGHSMSFADAWRATQSLSNVIVGVAVLLLAINVLAEFVHYLIPNALYLIGALLELAVTWLTMMLGISILTTIYGHTVEGRPLMTD